MRLTWDQGNVCVRLDVLGIRMARVNIKISLHMQSDELKEENSASRTIRSSLVLRSG